MPTPAPCSPRARKLIVLALALFALAGVSAQQPDPLFPVPPKPPGKADILPVLREAPGVPAPLPPPAGLPPLPGAIQPPLPGPPVMEPNLPPAVKYVNKPVVEFDYKVTKQGRAGVKSVALWVRRGTGPYSFPAFEGEEWKQVTSSNTPDDAPAKLRWEMPSDGCYGFGLQLTGNNDRKSTDFGPHAQPQMVVVLDTLPPVVKDVRLEPPAAGQKLAVIKWTATDANQEERCVKLEYEKKPGGGWATIAESERNTGSFSWPLDDKTPLSTRVRVTVTDQAGNSTSTFSPLPTNLDPVVPEGRLTGVRAVDPPKPADSELPSLPPPPESAPAPIPKARG